MPATCPNCGREIGPSDTFCDGCGRYLGWGEGPSPETVQVPVQPPQPGGSRAAVDVRLKSDLIEVAPGNAKSATFSVKNLGGQVEEFRLSVAGPEWIVVDPATMGVYPGDEVTGTIQAAPPRRPSSVAGITPFRLTATSSVHRPSVSSSAAGRVDVAPYYELASELVPTSSNGRGLTHHHIELDNRGNVPLRIGLNPTDVADGLRLGVPAVADVAPGQVVEISVSVYGTRRWFGRPEPKTFSIVAEAPKPLAANRLSGTRIVAPVFPRWVPAAAAGLVAVAVAAAVVVPKLTAHGTPLTSSSGSPSSAQPSVSSSSSASSSSASSSSASASSPTTSASGSASQVPVPDVTGSALPDAEAAISSKNLKPQPQASWVSPSAIAGNVVRTVPTADAFASPGSTVQLFAPIGTDELMPASKFANWTATSQFQPPSITLAFGGNESDNTGAALLTGPVTLANGAVITQALETHPPPLTNGYIQGVYSLSPAAIGGEQFRAAISFRQGTGGMIRYQVIAIDGNGSQQTKVDRTLDATASQVAQVIADLPAGTTKVALVVAALDNAPANDDVIWVNPRIEEANAPVEPLQPTASASPTPSSSGP
jgi:hypothetical protein